MFNSHIFSSSFNMISTVDLLNHTQCWFLCVSCLAISISNPEWILAFFGSQSRKKKEARKTITPNGWSQGMIRKQILYFVMWKLRLQGYSLTPNSIIHFFNFYFLIWESVWGRLVVPLTHSYIGWFSYVPWPEIKLTTLTYWDNTLTNRATQPEPEWDYILKHIPFLLPLMIAIV